MFENRITIPEYIDLPACRPDIVARSHQFMRFINHFFGGTAAVKQFIRYAHEKNKTGEINILDIGSGSCDIPVRILKWAQKKHINVKFTCIEKDSKALKNRPDVGDLPIVLVNSDIFDYQSSVQFDYAVASMFMHHLSDEEIVELVNRLRAYTGKGIFINDLHRAAFTYASCLVVSAFSKKEVRHDALISIQKGFRKNELEKLLSVPGRNITVALRPWGRITAFVEFNGERKH